MMDKLVIVASFVGLSLLFGASIWDTSNNPARLDEKVNLALRRTGHYLLLASGDSTSKIPVVKQTSPTAFVLQLNNTFNYNQLPSILQESLKLHQISLNYDVVVRDCDTQELQLGYNYLDYTKNHEVPCGGRNQDKGCFYVQIIFENSKPTAPAPLARWSALGLGLIMLGSTYMIWRKRQPIQPFLSPIASSLTSELINVGQSTFDIENQVIYTNGIKHNLTYREAKLLHLFVTHPNQVLERDFILKSVWEDEGIIVGRSIDVFVSRLRKLLQQDTSLKIAAVHGVGYRFETT